ncbi:SDR family NAD(P)-dependent oxidoreductase [Terrabacter terrigena]|uniref:SDR family NAD(P)-dependent oxidoreductase n=1 Tax=Terrabacter terrigena TaxID=574718 RepID=A0ABW3MVP5_9MICO
MRVETSAPAVAGQGVVVVGAGSGIGEACALLLARRGASVVCVDRDAAAADRTASSAVAEGGRAWGWHADVTDAASVAEAFAAAEEHLRQVHAVVNCAGVTGPLGLRSHEVSLPDFDHVVAINLRGALVVTQCAVPYMLKHGYGRIAHVASIAGKEGNPGMVAYSSTKAAIIGMVKAQGKEYAEDGITINALAPAVIRTAFLDTQPEETLRYMTDKIPMRRMGSVLEAAQMLAWMVSPECSFTTGFTFDLSGGRATY